MLHPFNSLAPEYAQLWSTMRVTPSRANIIDAAARRLLKSKARYQAVSETDGVPTAVLATLHERESGANFTTYLGNGQRLDRVTTIVPKGRGPFKTWEIGAKDALHLEHLDAIKDWSLERALYETEAWNGFGPRNHGIYTGYLWAGSNHYKRGKYVADGVWDATHADQQLGAAVVLKRMIELDPSLALQGMHVVPPTDVPIVPAPVPVGVGGVVHLHDTRWLQTSLNALIHAELRVDGNYGRLTKSAVRKWQILRTLKVDGLAGPITVRSIELALNGVANKGTV